MKLDKTTLAAALATIAVIVPAGWHVLDADIETDGPAFRPKQQAFTVDDATVTLDLDRGVMAAGDQASVTLVATSARRHRVAIDVAALQNMGFSGQRVEMPPKIVDERTVLIEAAPGGGPPVVATFRLAAHPRSHGLHEWFDIVARGAHAGREADSASVGVATWSGNDFGLAIEPPARLPAEGSFTVAVRVKNTTQQPLERPDIELGGPIRGVTGLDSEMVLSREGFTVEAIPDPLRDEAEPEPPLAPGQELLAIYKITPEAPGMTRFALTAEAHTSDTNHAALATVVIERAHSPAPEESAHRAPVAAR